MPKLLSRILLAVMLCFASSVAQAEWRRAGPVWNQDDARGKCPRVCGRDGWDGNWRQTGPGFEAVCNCVSRWSGGGYGYGSGDRGVDQRRGGWDRPRGPRTVQVDAGPIWHNGDAQNKCPGVCNRVGRWNGNWQTIGPGRSVCGCVTR
ncbi:mannan-binding protein [Bosea rubneri]|uniref:Mannan-binding protein n=1 Tax=Bosea rubneri TaxID=3075434 RepID=A0ABU3S6F2_9HYPH|nr:mannan-binding protein [Bosea sp. ZW T0_25]MDU0339972.1 mannan-binding protein [Bosea sp. ZW T0_25]